MKEIEDSISVLVQNHFPEFYKEEGDTFVAFVKAYYEWAQQTNNHVHFTRNLLEYRDIDKTIDDFLVHFKEKYLIEAPVSYDSTRQNVKNSLDFYRSKGTKRGTELFFKEVLNSSDVDVYFPGKDVLYASDGEWFVPVYLEVSLSDKTKTFVGKQITGSFSGATAFVESVGRKAVGGKFFDVVFISNVKGSFQYEEVITSDGVLENCPKIIGSLTNITINDSGRNFNVGDVVNIVSSQIGKQGKARVDSIESSTGKVSFNLLDGGTGYRITTTPLISEKTLKIKSVSSTNTYITFFTPDETIYQPLANVVFTTSNSYFDIGSLVTFSNSTANVATGRLVGTTQVDISGVATSNTTSNLVIGTGTSFSSELDANDYIRFSSCTTIFQVNSISNDTHLYLTTNGADVVSNTVTMANGNMLLVPVSGNFTIADRIANTTALISSYSNATASGKFVGGNTTFIGLYNVSNTFTANGYNYIYGASSNVHANVEIVGTGSGATFSIGSLTDTETVYLNLDIVSENNAIVTTQLTGTVTSNSTSQDVTGTSTLFSTELYNGAYVKFSGNTLVFQVNAITNNTFLSLKTNGPNVTSNTISITNGTYLSIPLNCLKYGFPKSLNSNSTTIINNALTKNSYTLGTIASLSQINPGNNYSISPVVRIRDDEIVGFDRRNLNLVVSGTSGVFVVGEELTQDFSDPGFTLEISGSNTAISVTETITQQINNTSNAYGEVSSSNLSVIVVSTGSNFVNSALGSNLTGTITSNTTSPRVNGSSTLFTSEVTAGDYIKFSGNSLIFQVNNVVSDTELYLTTNSSLLTAGNTYALATNVAVGMTSNTIFFVNTAISNNILYISRGTVLSVSNTSLNVKRKTFNQSFTPGVLISGSTSGASANVVSVTQIQNSEVMGNNAVVNSYAGIVEGSISGITVIDSGFSYDDGELINIVGSNNLFIATGYANLINQGVGEGFFKSTKGFLNSDKYLHDGYFYQFYSYQVKSPLPLNEYSETLKKFMHVAGMILFGNVFKTSVANVTISSLGVTIET